MTADSKALEADMIGCDNAVPAKVIWLWLVQRDKISADLLAHSCSDLNEAGFSLLRMLLQPLRTSLSSMTEGV